MPAGVLYGLIYLDLVFLWWLAGAGRAKLTSSFRRLFKGIAKTSQGFSRFSSKGDSPRGSTGSVKGPVSL